MGATMRWCGVAVLGALVVGGAAHPALAQRARVSPAAQEVVGQRAEIFNRARETGDFETAEIEMRRLVDRAAAWVTPRDADALREAELGRRMMRFLNELPEDRAPEFYDLLDARPALATHLLFAWQEGPDREPEMAELLMRLVEARPRDVDRYPALAAAVALVHDGRTPFARRVNENTARAGDPLEIFAFFADRAGDLRLDPARLPVEALTFVVDVTEPMEEMAWAHDRYHAQPNVGARFFEIDYDTDHFKRGRPKKLTASGVFSLRSIHRWGGVCVDQAYFAEHVAKASGVPSVTMGAAGAGVGHAWVGYIERRGRSFEWNLDAGRYEPYKVVVGSIVLPQTGERVPDAHLELLAGWFTEPDRDRWDAVAAASAARLWTVGVAPEDPEPLGDRPTRRAARTGAIEDRLELLRMGLSRAPGLLEGWKLLGDLGATGELTPELSDEWARALDRMCGREYPAFSVSVLSSLFLGVEDLRERDKLWEWAYRRYDARKDLAARCRIEQARIAAELGDTARAMRLIDEVVARYANDTAAVLEALRFGEDLLRATGQPGQVARMYETAWTRIVKPGQTAGEFVLASNWYRVGSAYLRVLKELGDPKAADVQRRLNTA